MHVLRLCHAGTRILSCSATVFADCVVMVKVKKLASEQIAAVTSLCKEGKFNKEIVLITGVSLHSVQR